VLNERPPVPWFEVHPENYMMGGPKLHQLETVRQDYALSLHAVGLSLGSSHGLEPVHLQRLKTLTVRLQPGLVSDHLSWSSHDGVYLADLLPLPYTEEALAVMCRNIDAAQEALARQILIENPSTYLRYQHSTLSEGEFLGEIARRTGCGLLCDVNNFFVTASNHGDDPTTALNALPRHAVGEIHLAGHALVPLDNGQSIRIDDHGSKVDEAVWTLYAAALSRFGAVPTLIEWDTNLPPFAILEEEARRAQMMINSAEFSHAAAE
jgi:uncharacterized protein (UPF0276 family)